MPGVRQNGAMPAPCEMIELLLLCAQAERLRCGKTDPSTAAAYQRYWRMYWEAAGIDPEDLTEDRCREALFGCD